jgi:hypothetical protein
MSVIQSSSSSLRILRKHLQRLKRRWILSRKPADQVFDEIYRSNNWGDVESVSGPGSRLDRTDKIRAALPELIKKYDCRSLLDIPCGDFNWMKTLDLNIEYVGGDIVVDLIELNQQRYAGRHKRFLRMDLLRDPLPEVDLIFCRDCLVHFSNSDVMTALQNMKASGSKYLLTTTFPERRKNQSIATGEWRPVNLCTQPFSLPAPMEFVDDSYDSPNYYDKHLGFWSISDLPDF